LGSELVTGSDSQAATGGGNRPRIVELFTALGYKAFTLEHGREIPLTAASAKDIIFRPQ